MSLSPGGIVTLMIAGFVVLSTWPKDRSDIATWLFFAVPVTLGSIGVAAALGGE